jgi:hypothetical protein
LAKSGSLHNVQVHHQITRTHDIQQTHRINKH